MNLMEKSLVNNYGVKFDSLRVIMKKNLKSKNRKNLTDKAGRILVSLFFEYGVVNHQTIVPSLLTASQKQCVA